jgi:hypothetical protein
VDCFSFTLGNISYDVVCGVEIRFEGSGKSAKLLLVRVDWYPTTFDEGHGCSGGALHDGDGDLRGEVVHVEAVLMPWAYL